MRRYKSTLLLLLFLGTLSLAVTRFAVAQQAQTEPTLGVQTAPPLPVMAASAGRFQPYISYALTDPRAQAVGIGDFNDDGRADVAVTAGFYTPTYLSIFLQGVDGQLQSPVRYPANARPEALAVGDLNNDGRDDIAVTSFMESKISIYFQTAAGTLAEKVDSATQQGPDAIAIGDITGDGRPDVIVSHWNHSSIGVLKQQADGSLAPMILYPAPQAGYDDLDWGDVNGDGHADVVKMNGQGYSNPNLALFYQSVTGTLTSMIPYDLEGDFLSHGMAVGDVTGDGRADVVITHRGDATEPFAQKLSVFAQQADGSLQRSATYAAPASIGAVEIDDIDGDGRKDVLTINDLKLILYLQTASGTLAPYESYDLPYATTYKPQGLDVGDINQDGRPDVVMANYNVGLVVLYQATGAAPTATPTLIPTAAPGSTPTPVVTPTPGAIPTSIPAVNSLRVLYLPMIAIPKQVEAAIFTATTQCLNEAANWEYAPAIFSYGKRLLATSITFRNQIGHPWRAEWKVDGRRRPDLDKTGTITQSPEDWVVQIVYGPNGQCELPLPRGVYEVEIYLSNELVRQGKATIQ